jgi:hypothetical protein
MAPRFALIMSLMLAFACGGPAPSPTVNAPETPAVFDGRVTTYEGDEMAFEYSARWQAVHFENVSSFTRLLVYLSTEQLFEPCVRQLNAVSCGSPLRSNLGPDGVFIEWIHWGFPGREFDSTLGSLIDVGGRRATFQHHAPTEECIRVGADDMIVVTVEWPQAQSNWHEMTACLRGPDLDKIQEEIDSMLGSVRWVTPPQVPRQLPTGLR